MKRGWNRFAPIGLYLALAALLSSLGFYIVQHTFSLGVQISLGILILGIATFILLDPQRVRQAFTGRQARYGSNALVITLAMLGILIVINYLAYKNTKTWDLTEDKTYSLAKETLDILNKLPEPVVAQAFYTSNLSTDTARKLLDSYQLNSKGKFSYKFIDPNADPLAAQAAKVTRDGTIVLKTGDRQEQITYPDEQELTNALIRLANPGQRIVYFVTGHGESDINGTDTSSLSQLKKNLESKNYTVNTLNLLSQAQIPKDALAVIIAGPKKPLTNQEVSILKTYADQGGALVILYEPSPISGIDNDNDPLVKYLTDSWGVTLDNDLILDPNVDPMVVTYAAPDSYGQHPITQKMTGVGIVFPTARSIEINQNAASQSTVKLAVTAQNAWGETDLAALKNNQASIDPNKDIVGPLTLAISSEKTNTKSRLVVIGDVDFSTDKYFNQFGNGDFIMNSIDWAAVQENLINLTTKPATTRQLANPLLDYQIGLLLLLLVFIIPGLVIVMGIIVWVQRRRRG